MAGDMAVQGDNNGIRIAFCESFVVDELWVDAWTGKRQPLWRAQPNLTVEPGDIISRTELDGTFTLDNQFDLEGPSDLIVHVQNGATSREADFSLRDGLPTDEWLQRDGKVTSEACPVPAQG